MIIINAVLSVLASSAVLLYLKYDNAFRLTLRGKRVLFVLGILFFFGLFQVSQNLYVECDLRDVNASDCKVFWGFPY
jgi:hypothetical protein